MRTTIVAAATLALLCAAPALAQDLPDDFGFTLAVSGTYAVPSGELERDGAPLDTIVNARTPIGIHVGYRFGGRVFTGLFLQLSPKGVVDSACPADACSASGVRYGLEVQLHARPGATLDPWLGLGGGIETLETTVEDVAGDREVRWAGFEGIVTAGVDLAFGRRFAIAPFASASFGQFTSVREEAGGDATSERLEARTSHSWLEAGVRLRVDL